MLNTNLNPVKGTRDFYPNEMRFRKWLFGKMRTVSEKFGFEEYDGPILEPIELYLGKSGEELVNNQTFQIKDKSGKTIVLRPELTPSLARMVAIARNQLIFPIKWFSIGQAYRYEQPQKGREREFFQWEVNILGTEAPEADSEVIAVTISLLQELGFNSNELVVKINSRKLMDYKLSQLQISDDKKKGLIRAIDKKDKMETPKWIEYIKSIGLSESQVTDLEKILNNTEYKTNSPELTKVFSTLSDLGLADYVEYDPNIVRGLDYYTGTVFEVRDRKGEFRAIIGGGRYDNLVEKLGGGKIEGVGFAAGDVLLKLLLEKYNKIPKFNLSNTQVLVTVFDQSIYRKSANVTKLLREKNINAEIYLKNEKLDKQLKYADKKGVPYAIIIGPEEEKEGKVTVKDLVNRKQETVFLDDFINKMRNR